MNKTPLAVFSGLVVAAATATGYFAVSRSLPPVPPAPADVRPVQEVAGQKPEPAPAPQGAIATAVPAAPPKTEPAAAPSFDTARVDAAGSAIVAGRAAPGSDVKLTWNGAVIATTKANDAGEFVVIPDKPLPAGPGNLGLEANLNGTAAAPSQTVPVSVKSALAAAPAPAPAPVAVATAEPPKPETAKSMPDAASVDAVGYDQSGSIQFSGHAHPGGAVHLFVDGRPTAEIKADDKGQWTYANAAGIPAGTHDLRAEETDASGNVVARVTLPFKREDKATVLSAEAVASAGPAQSSPAERPHSVTIQPGNTLWRLSRELYGAGRNYTVIFQANKSQIKNPRLIYPGQILATPEKSGN